MKQLLHIMVRTINVFIIWVELGLISKAQQYLLLLAVLDHLINLSIRVIRKKVILVVFLVVSMDTIRGIFLLICLCFRLLLKLINGEINNLLMRTNILKKTSGFIPTYKKPIKTTVNWNTLRKLRSLYNIHLLKTLLILPRN